MGSPEASPRRGPAAKDSTAKDPAAKGAAAYPSLGGGDPDPARVAGWVRAVQNGDSEAFGDLVEAYGRLLYRVIGRLVSDPDDREDLVQETFVRAYQAIDRFRSGSDFRPWLLTIALNAVRDQWRRRRRRPSVASLDDEGEEVTVPASDPAPDAVVEGDELRQRAEAAFRRLDQDAQAILWLRVRESLQYDEIAQVLGIPRGTVMSRLARAREALRRELEFGSNSVARSEE